jgi:hypothetical protein
LRQWLGSRLAAAILGVGRRPHVQRDAEVREQLRERRIFRPFHEAREEFGEITARELACQRGNAVLRDTDARASIAFPQRAHEVVQRMTPVEAQREVERASDERSFRVVADERVRRVLVLPVILDPGIEARIGDALRVPPGRAHHGRERASEKLEVACGPDQSAAHEGEVVVIRGDAFECPELARVRLARQIVG